jgi:spore coat polysaccharide biosynthesis protein SpsF
MDRTLGIVQLGQGGAAARATALRKLGGKPLVEWVVRRVTDCQRLDRVIVVLADHPDERALISSIPPDVPVYLAHHKDALGRLVEALAHHSASAVVRVCAEGPFVDSVAIDRLVTTAAAHPECDYISYCQRDGQPVVLSPLAIFAEWCAADALRAAHREATSPLDRRHATRYLFSHPEKFRVRLLPLPEELDRDDLRLRIDHDEDWEHAQAIYEALGGHDWDWQRIADLLDHQPALRRRMAALNRSGA